MKWSLVSLAGLAVFGVTTAAHADPMNFFPLPDARIAFGPSIPLGAKRADGLRAATDFTVGASLFGSHGFNADKLFLFLDPEGGYSYTGPSDHAFNVSMGIGFGTGWVAAAYHPHFIVGTSDDEFAIGMRNGLGIHALFDVFSLEVAHELLFVDSEQRQDLRVELGLNPGAAVALFIYLISGMR
ncbi:MAG: hypothetical protein U0271_06260 [Polyangiaceae bacterium]